MRTTHPSIIVHLFGASLLFSKFLRAFVEPLLSALALEGTRMLARRYYFSKILLGTTAVAALITFSSPIMAEDDQRLYRDAYYLGRGDTGLAIADDQQALMYNPAGLAKGKGIYKRLILLSPAVELSDDARNLVKELQADNADIPAALKKRVGKNEHIGIYNLTALVLRRASIGVFNSQTTDILVHKSPEAGGLEGVKARLITSNGVVFGLAQDFMNQRLLVGGNLKYMHRGEASLEANITDSDSLSNMQSDDLLKQGLGTSMDLGVMYKIPAKMETSVGATINNVGSTTFSSMTEDSAAPSRLKQVVNLGVAVEPSTKFSRFRLLGEYWDATNVLGISTLKKLHIGAELSIKDIIGFTAGMSGGWTSGGFYLDIYALRLDGGIYIQEMDDRIGVRPDKRLFFRLTTGF